MSWVYFGRRADGAIKIGFSRDPRRRCAGLKLVLLACFKGGRAEEAAEHLRWRSFALGNEYFSSTPRLLTRIESLTRVELPGHGASIFVRLSDEDSHLLNEEVAREEREHPGRCITRSSLAKEIVITALRMEPTP